MLEPPVLSFRYAYDGQGEIAFAEWVLREYTDLKAVDRVRQGQHYLGGLVSLILAIGGGIYVEKQLTGRSVALGVLLGGLFWIACMLYLFRNSPDKSLVGALKKQRDAQPSREAQGVELTVNAAGVRVSYDTGEHLVRWKLFSEIIVLDTHVIIAYADHVGGVCIPRGVFVDDQHLQASLATLRAWLVHSGVDDTARIRDLLSKTHVNCKCGQDLFGLTTNTCPECGHTWRYHTLSMHNYVQNPTAFKAD